MRFLVLIPARGGSKRLPRKNIKLLGDRPLIVWSIDIAKSIPDVCDILVSTDDHSIASISSAAGALVPWLRPSNLATDTATSVDVALHALDWYESEHGVVDAVMLLQPTSPYRSRETILEGVKQFNQQRKSVVAVSEVKVHPERCFFIQPHSLKMCIPTSNFTQENAYAVNGSLYLITPDELRKNRSFFSLTSVPLVVNSHRESLDIDDDFDWWLAKRMIEQ
jgi:CMP-N,N'-diacetyllegionaminic acid synthase